MEGRGKLGQNEAGVFGADLGLNAYQAGAMNTALGQVSGIDGLVYCSLKLNGEAGEVAELVGKWMRGDYGEYVRGEFPAAQLERLIKEAGDVQWYLAALMNRAGVSLAGMAAYNLDKLELRRREEKLRGSGSDR
jgi:NTP pyrophosphatase (non-canonical NTP hydrolase)